jgi:hypothetical protein
MCHTSYSNLQMCYALHPGLRMCHALDPHFEKCVMCSIHICKCVMRVIHIYKMCCAPQGTQDGMARQVSGLDGVVTGGGLCIHQHAFGEHGFWSTMHISRPFQTEVIGKFLLLQD